MQNRFTEQEFSNEAINIKLWQTILKLLSKHYKDLFLMFFVIMAINIMKLSIL